MPGPEPTRSPSPQPVRWDLVAHIREQIEADPEAYANEAKLRLTVERLLDSELRQPK